MTSSRLLPVILFTAAVLVKAENLFGYNADDELGPDRWGDEFADCAGKYQSPVDIEEGLVTRVSMPGLTFSGTHDLPHRGVLTNNGHTVLLEVNSTRPVKLRGGPLASSYTFEQLHFHWGSNDSFGSEDLINNKSFPMELHMVFFKSSYANLSESLNHKDGLAVLALFFEISEEDNRAYSELVDSLYKVEYPGTAASLPYLLPLDYLLPPDQTHYFTYNGSLTTPPCLEIVTWIEFKHPVHLSHRQLDLFRKLRSFDGLLTHNGRPVQPLHGRPVWYNIENLHNDAPIFTLPSPALLLPLMASTLLAH